MRKLIPYLLVFFVLNTALDNASAQKVGVVLSGGGARGAAHIGVLKALEENGIPIDYIAGTSMGAIIGGMYASGFSPDSIQGIITDPNFQNWATGNIEAEYSFFYAQNEPNASWINLRFTVDSVWQHRMPTNLVAPYQMDFAGLQFLTAPNVVSGGDFDKLFVPYRCVAADIQEKVPVIFKSGELFPAIRASMTYPFVFRPIRVDGRLLFDGGIYNNFPVDVMIDDFDPDLIIGSVVSANFPAPKEEDIRSHLENMMVFRTEYEIPQERGFVIRPDIPATGLTDFSNSKALVDSGYVATVAMLEDIFARIDRRISSEEITQKRREFNDKKPPIVIERIFFKGINEAQREYISKLLLKDGDPTPLEDIKSAYFRLLTKDHIESIEPTARFNALSGFYDLYLDVKLNKDLLLQFGGNISSTPVNFAFIEANYNYLDYQAYEAGLNAYFGRFYSAIKLHGRMDLSLNVPIFVKTTASFNFYDFFKSTTTFFQDRNPSYLLQNQNFWEAQAGVPVKNSGKFLLGFTAGRNRDDYYQTNFFGRTDIADRTNFSYASPHMQFERSTLNRKLFPNSGTHLFSSLRFIAGTEHHRPGTTSFYFTNSRTSHRWWQFRLTYLNHFASKHKTRFGFYGEVNLSNKQLFNNYTSSLLAAGFFDLVPESRTLFLRNYRANNFAVSGFQGIYSVAKNIDFRMEAYIFQPFKEILPDSNNNAIYGPLFRKRYLLLTSALVVNSPIGPISLNVNFYDRNDDPFSFSFNFGYLIFNPRPLR
jgi:NTE family protein